MAEQGFSTPISRNFEGLTSSSPKEEKSKGNMSRQDEEHLPDGERFMETSPETNVASKEERRTSKDDSDL